MEPRIGARGFGDADESERLAQYGDALDDADVEYK